MLRIIHINIYIYIYVCVCVVQQCCSDVCFFNVVATSIYQQWSDVGGQRCPDYSKKTTVFQGWIPTSFQRYVQPYYNVVSLLDCCLGKR